MAVSYATSRLKEIYAEIRASNAAYTASIKVCIQTLEKKPNLVDLLKLEESF